MHHAFQPYDTATAYGNRVWRTAARARRGRSLYLRWVPPHGRVRMESNLGSTTKQADVVGRRGLYFRGVGWGIPRGWLWTQWFHASLSVPGRKRWVGLVPERFGAAEARSAATLPMSATTHGAGGRLTRWQRASTQALTQHVARPPYSNAMPARDAQDRIRLRSQRQRHRDHWTSKERPLKTRTMGAAV